MTNQELITNAISKMSTEEKSLIFPPIEIKFVNNKNQVVTYNHDTILEAMLPKLSIMPCWIKRGYWSQSTNLPTNVRHLAEIVDQEVEVAK